MYGLSVRWSLEQVAAGTEERLREYVVGTSIERFTGLPGLRFKTWRMRPAEWFEGTYVFARAEDRDGFEAGFRRDVATAPGTQIVGAVPVVIERFEVVAVAEGGAGFAAGPGPGPGPGDGSA
jgi:hypothetical protein